MANHPVESVPPPEDTIGQLGQEGSINRSEMLILFEGVVEEMIGVAIRPFHFVQEVEADRPRMLSYQNFPVLAISSSLATRSSIGGWVLKRERTPPPLNGLTINMCAVEGLAFMGILRAAISSLLRAFAK